MRIKVIGVLVNKNPNDWIWYEATKDTDTGRCKIKRYSGKTQFEEYINDEANYLDRTGFYIKGHNNLSDRLQRLMELHNRINQKQQDKVRAIWYGGEAVAGDNEFKRLFLDELIQIEKTLNPSRNEPCPIEIIEETKIIEVSNYSTMILGGFIAALGIAAVAVAFTVLNAATLGVAGLVVAGIGAVALLGGIGIFETATSKKYEEVPKANFSSNLEPV